MEEQSKRIEVWREDVGEVNVWRVKLPGAEAPFMTTSERSALDEVLQGFLDLGGEADWDIRELEAVPRNR